MPSGIFVPARLADLTGDLTFSGAAQGDLIVRGASGWKNQGAGTSGQYLKTLGVGADPVWASVSGVTPTTNWLNAKTDFGANGGGSVDDTTAIQNGINAAIAAQTTLYLPAGTYKITSGLQLGPSGSQCQANIIGDGPVQTTLAWHGSTSGTIALLLNNLGFGTLQGFTLNNGTGTKGTTEGIRSTGPGFGTDTYGLVIQNVHLNGWHYGWRTSNGSGNTSSELTFIDASFAGCDEGFRNDDFNALNMNFVNLQTGGCGIGVRGVTAGLFVRGGASSGNAIDFQFEGGGNYMVSGFRSEVEGRFLVAEGQVATSNIAIRDCDIGASTNGDGNVIYVAVQGMVTLDSSVIHGHILIDSFTGQIAVANCAIQDTQVLTPIDLGSGSTQGTCFDLRNNLQLSASDPNVAVGKFPDQVGLWGNQEEGHLIERTDVFNTDIGNGRPEGLKRSFLNTRSLSGNDVLGSNLRGQATFATASTVAVLFKRTTTVNTYAGHYYGDFSGSNITPDDVGRAIVITGVGPSGANLTTTITRGAPPGGSFYLAKSATSAATGASATVGDNEPDATYYLAVTGNVNETFWVTGKATTGFTIHSSNGSSTATVDWVLIR